MWMDRDNYDNYNDTPSKKLGLKDQLARKMKKDL